MTTVDVAVLDAVIFDMDGVVTETATVHAAAWKRLFDEYLKGRSERTGEAFVPFDERLDYEQYVDGRSRYDGVATFLASRSIVLPTGEPTDAPDVETACGLGNGKDAYFHAHVREHGVRAYPSTVELIHALRARRIRVGLVTSSRNGDEVLGAAGVRDLFDARVDGLDAARLGLAGKPAPATYLEAAARLGVDPARAAIVEDAISGVEAGRRGEFGLVVGVARTGQTAALREAGADVVVTDCAEIDLGPPSPSDGRSLD